MNKQEEFQNRALAKLLSERGVAADYEQRGARKKMDVVAEVDGLRIVLEAETGFHRKAQAIKDADACLRQKLATVMFAVCYPTGVTEDNLADATLIWTVRLKSGEPAWEWSTGGLTQLAQAVLQVPHSLSGADVAAQWLSDGLDAAAQRLKTPVRRTLAQAPGLPATQPQGGQHSDGYFVTAKRGMLVVATAMLFHHRLPAERPDGYEGEWPPASATVCAEQEAVISAFREAWRGILAVDYRPVFETGRTALSALSIDPDTAQAVSSLASVVARVSEQAHGLRHDLLVMARVDNGFAVAEEDLKFRGPGDFFGARQSGLPDLRQARLSDQKLLATARKEASALLSQDPHLERPEHRLIREALESQWPELVGEIS